MKNLRFIYRALVVACVLFGMFVLVGCGYRIQKPYKPSRFFPTKIPETSKYSISYNAKGKFFISDQKGEALPAECIPLSKLLKVSKKSRKDWLTVLGSFKLYQVKNDNSVWLCDKSDQCYKGVLKNDEKRAVLALNYDGNRLFISDADGGLVTPKDLRSFASMIEETDLSAKYGIKELSNITIYKIIGSDKVSSCFMGRCLCTCLYEDRDDTGCIEGECPD